MLANPKIFKTYDIRGEWNKDWDKELVYNIGRAIALHLQPKIVALGRDKRNSSEEIFSQLCTALIDQGVKVKDLGVCGTELTYFSAWFAPEIDVAIMITASHNPAQDNGLKITLHNSVSLGLDTGLNKIRDLSFSELPELPPNKGSLEKMDLWSAYQEHVFKLTKIKLENIPLKKIVIDAGNGIAGYMFDRVLSSLNLNLIKMFWEPDGNFPHHPPDPSIEKNTYELKQRVLQEKADLGIAYDGDGDRIFFIDEKGRYIYGYYLTALIADYLLSQSLSPEKEIIIYDPRYYWAVLDCVQKYRAKAISAKVGHTLIKADMRKNKALFSGEGSGHFFYRENNFVESTMMTTLLILKMISEKGPLSQQVDYFFQKYPMGDNLNFKLDQSCDPLIIKMEQIYSEGKISKWDGLNVDFSDWRFNLRGSNTQPLVRLSIEAKNYVLLQQKIEELKKLIGGKLVDE